MPTRSMKERVLMRKSRKFAKEADSIILIISFLIHLGTQRKENRRYGNEYLHTTPEDKREKDVQKLKYLQI